MAKSEKMVSVNPNRLKYAREYYGETLQDVSLKTKIAKQKLEDFELGKDYPSYVELSKLSDYYKQPLLFFFLQSIPKNNKMMVAFRGLEDSEQRPISKRIRELIEKADIYRLNLEELYGENEKPKFIDLVNDDKVEADNFIEWLRVKLSISVDSQIKEYNNASLLFEDFRNKLFDIGIYVFKDSFKDDSVSGLCLFDENRPVILINNKTTFNRQLFTLFHEVYHIFCHNNDVDFITKNEEKACNTFASEFLIPQKQLLDDIEGKNIIDELLLDELSKKYCVSRDAIAYRLYKMNKISEPEYQQVHEAFSPIRKSNGSSGGSYYYTKKAYLGDNYIKEVYSQYYSGKITISQVGIFTQMKASTAKAFSLKVFGGGF